MRLWSYTLETLLIYKSMHIVLLMGTFPVLAFTLMNPITVVCRYEN